MSFMDAVRAGVFTVPGDGPSEFASIIKAVRKHQYFWLDYSLKRTILK